MSNEIILKREDFTKENIEVLMSDYKADSLFIAMIDDNQKIPVAVVNEINDLFITNILSYNKDCKILIQDTIIGNIMYLLFEKSSIDRLHLEHYRYLNKYKNKVKIENKILDGLYVDLNLLELDRLRIKENITNDSLGIDIYDKDKLVLSLKDVLYIGEISKKELNITVLKYKENRPYIEHYYIETRED